jgi:hypothetical protein
MSVLSVGLSLIKIKHKPNTTPASHITWIPTAAKVILEEDCHHGAVSIAL